MNKDDAIRLAAIAGVGALAWLCVKFADQPNEVAGVVALAVAFAASSAGGIFFPQKKKDGKNKAPVDDFSDEEEEVEEEVERVVKSKKKKTRNRSSAKKAKRAAARVIREAAEAKQAIIQAEEDRKAEQAAREAEKDAKSSKSKKKRKKKKKNKNEPAAVRDVEVEAEPEQEVAPENEWQTMEVRLTKKQKQKIAKEKALLEMGSDYEEEDAEQDTEISFKVDQRHYRTLIGKGGEMLRKIREATEAEIQLPKKGSMHDLVIVTGTTEQCALAKTTILQIVKEGFSELTHPGTTKNTIEVPIKMHPRIVGRGGETIRALQDRTETNINLPDKTTGSTTVVIVGDAEGVMQCKAAIRELLEKGYSELTHDGWDSIEIPFEQALLPSLIGKGGSTIKALQQRYGVDIDTPEKDDTRNYVRVTGPADQIALVAEEIRTLGVVHEVPMDIPWQGADAGHDLSALNSWD